MAQFLMGQKVYMETSIQGKTGWQGIVVKTEDGPLVEVHFLGGHPTFLDQTTFGAWLVPREKLHHDRRGYSQ